MSPKQSILLVMLALGGAGAWHLRPEAEDARPAPAGYVSSTKCQSCHPDEAARWQGSPHDLAMAAPTPETVRGDFEDTSFEDTRFRREGTQYYVEVRAAAGGYERHRVAYTFGIEPLQQYLLELPRGRLQASAIAWDTQKNAWFRVQAPEFHYTSRYQSWNTMCADCHSTNVDKGYDPATDTFATTFSEVDVGCQSCHGPGARHVEDPSVPLPARTDVEACAACHSRRAPITPQAVLTEPFTDHYRPMTLQPGLYFSDGQILDEVFEYGSFTQSAMYASGVTCVDCHEPHGATKANDNATCTKCHGPKPPLARFPSLASRARDLDRPEHHHHAEGSPGAQCVSCHMPPRVYLGVDVRHDHRLGIPRPDLSAKLGTPNACTSACHEGQSATWAAAKVSEWFPRSKPRPEHFGEVFARAQRGMAHPDELLAVAEGAAPAIVRATALEYLMGDHAACIAAARLARHDVDPLIRSLAVACAEGLRPQDRAAEVVWALRDPSRLVRLEAARALAGASEFLTDPDDQARYRAARTELGQMYESQRDRPEGAFNLGLLAEAEGRPQDAAAHYLEALRQDPEFVPAQANLLVLRREGASQRRSEN